MLFGLLRRHDRRLPLLKGYSVRAASKGDEASSAGTPTPPAPPTSEFLSRLSEASTEALQPGTGTRRRLREDRDVHRDQAAARARGNRASPGAQVIAGIAPIGEAGV
jgi:hypothetical protein